ncbi:MAG: hypothetical protein MOB07_27400 [Acidobacteria bacterium]|nr:hypothetical protein [Acidobacteriota bacterium]
MGSSWRVDITEITPSDGLGGCLFWLILGPMLLSIVLTIVVMLLPLALIALWGYGIYKLLKCEGTLAKAVGISMILIGVVCVGYFIVLINQFQASSSNPRRYSAQQPNQPSTIYLETSDVWREVRLPYNSRFTVTATKTVIIRMSDGTEFELTPSGDVFKYGRKVSSLGAFTVPLYIKTKNRNQKADVNFLPVLSK